MPITSFRDNENNRWERIAKKKQKKQTKTEKNRTRGTEAYSERVRDKWFCCVIIYFIITM